MMNQSYNIDGGEKYGNPVGRMRGDSEEVFAGDHQYTPGSSMMFAVDSLVRKYIEESDVLHPIDLAIYELVTIHPFINGNGRIGRLFLTWCLMRDGFPFPISFSSGHSKCRQHYLEAIKTARRPLGTRGNLNVIVIESMNRTLDNYFENLRILNGGYDSKRAPHALNRKGKSFEIAVLVKMRRKIIIATLRSFCESYTTTLYN